MGGIPRLPRKDSWTGKELTWCTRQPVLEKVESDAVIKNAVLK